MRAGGRRGAKASDVAVVAQCRRSRGGAQPGAGERGEVQAVGGVAGQVVQVDERRLAEVVVGEVEVADLGGDDRLDRRRQRRVADGDRLVVLEVARASAPASNWSPQR